MKFQVLALILICGATTLSGQVKFAFDNTTLHLEKHTHYPAPLAYDSPIQSGESLESKLFKGYFNPGSYEAYREFFVPGEMPQISLKEYLEWQDLLKVDRLHLHDCFQIKDQNNQQYIVFQYTMDNPQFMYYHSLIMKQVGTQWKHISFEKDAVAAPLRRIGQMKAEYIDEANKVPVSTIDLDSIPKELTRTSFEKFNRTTLVEKLESVFVYLELTEDERSKAKELFLSDQDGEMLMNISNQHSMDYLQLVNLVNNACGFKLIKYTSSETE